MALSATRIDLLEALAQIQNHPAHANTDIMTITGCGMTDDEVRRHIERNIEDIIRFNEEQASKTKRRGRK